MKKIAATIGLLMTLFAVFFLILNKTANNSLHANELTNNKKDYLFDKSLVLEAKMDDFSTLKAIEESAELIVVGKKTKQNSPTIIYNAFDRIELAYTLSTFQIEKVIKGDSIAPDVDISIMEQEAYNKRENVTYHINGYELMKTNHEYLLFLRKSTTDPFYLIIGTNPGKVPLQEESSALLNSSQNTNTYYSSLLESMQRDNAIREDARKKYASFLK